MDTRTFFFLFFFFSSLLYHEEKKEKKLPVVTQIPTSLGNSYPWDGLIVGDAGAFLSIFFSLFLASSLLGSSFL